MRHRVRQVILPLVLACVAMVVSAPAALAASRLATYQNDIFIGDPIPWTNHANYFWTDSTAGSQTLRLQVCNGNPDITLMRLGSAGWVPAGANATKRFWCLNTDGGTLTWTNIPTGTYHYEVTNPRNGTTELDIAYAYATY